MNYLIFARRKRECTRRIGNNYGAIDANAVTSLSPLQDEYEYDVFSKDMRGLLVDFL
jgi:hypothetical protein